MTFFKTNFKNITDLLSAGAKDRNSPYHTPIFSNISINNNVESRTVVLRKFDKKNLILIFHTDLRSPKVFDLKKNENSIFVFYDPKIKIQLKIKTISNIHNKDEITKEAWQSISLSSRKCYLSKKSPSSITKIPQDGIPKNLIGINPSKAESEKGYKNFVLIKNKITQIDWLHLSSKGHRRLKIEIKNKKPLFNWIIP